MANTFKNPGSNPTLAAVITGFQFAGGSRLSDMDPDGLTNLLRGLAMDHARIKLENTGVADFTDSSAGTAADDTVAMTIPTAAFDASAAGGVTAADFDTTMGEYQSAFAVIADHLNNVRARIGRKVLTWAEGTITTAGTIPACDNAMAAGTGAGTPTFASASDRLTKCRNNFATLSRALNQIAAALGEPTLTESTSRGTPDMTTYALVAIAASTSSADGVLSVQKTVMDAFCAAMRNNIASLARKFNVIFFGAGLTDLTDSLSGTVSNTLAALTIPTAAAVAATTASPKAGFDTAIGVIGNNLRDIEDRTNELLRRYNLVVLTDGGTATGAAPDGTIATHSVALTAVDGTGANAVNSADGILRLTAIKNAIASLAVKINALAPYFGAVPLTNNSGGAISTVLGTIATATGTGANGTESGLLDVDVDAFLVIVKNAESSLTAKLAEFTGTDAGSGTFTKPLHVVAGI